MTAIVGANAGAALIYSTRVLDAVEAKYRQQRLELEVQLSKGPERLRVQSAQAENHLSQLLAGMQQRLLQVAQSEADMRVVAA